MPFPRETQVQRTPTGIGAITVLMQTDNNGGKSIKGQFEVLDQNGDVMDTVRIPLAEHLTQTQINQLQSFMDLMRSRAISEILPAVQG